MTPCGSWQWSVLPDQDPDDHQRIPENKQLRALRGDSVEAVPSEDDLEHEIMADSGPATRDRQRPRDS